MTSRRFRREIAGALRAGAVVIGFLLSSVASEALAEGLLPENFFDKIPQTGTGQAGVEADQLHFDSETGIITASGNVGLSYVGYFANADRMIFNQITRELLLQGHVHIVDPAGTEYEAERVEITNQFKDAVLDAMVMVTKDGAMITGTQTRKIRDATTEVDKGIYAPCGTCIDAKGRRIGWRVRTERIIQNTKDGYTDLEQPILEVLGFPIAWLPWIRLPDMTDPRKSGFRMPNYNYNQAVGLKIDLPYYFALNRDMGVLFTPSLISTQGMLLGAEFTHNVGTIGRYSVAARGIYQLNPGAFSPGFGDTRFRGAIQTSGTFTPVERWTVGWSYTSFTDPAFLTDYMLSTENPAVNQAYAQYLSPQTFGDVRVQEFRLLEHATQLQQDQQAALLPKARVEHVEELGPDGGTVRIGGDFNAVLRAEDQVLSNGVAYRLGTEEVKTHAMGEADWSRQFIAGSVLVTPMAGLRLDYATYNGASALQPGAETLLSATPIAALDVRMPFVAYDGGATYLVEPVAQAYYRGGPAKPGITNDNAQSFTFDESTLFSYNKFSSTDRQETGLRANLGVHYLANFADGSYIDTVLGQSFHLAGANSLATADAVNAGAGAGLSGASSDIVAGARIGMGDKLTLSAKARYDIAAARIAAAAARVTYVDSGWAVGLDYSYLAPDASRGYTATQQDIGASVSVPLADYWKLNAAVGWDLTAAQLVDYSAGIVYDDGYFEAGARVTSSGPLVYDPSTFTYKLTLKIKGPDGVGFGLE